MPKISTSVHSICVFMIAVYMMLLPFEYVLTSEAGTLNKYIGVLIMGLCFISGTFRIKFKVSNILIICFLIYGVMSGLWAISTSYWSEVFFIYLKNAALFLVVAQCKFSKKQNNLIMSFFVLGAVLLALYLMTSSNVTIDPFSGRTVISVNGGYFDPNYMAADIIMPIGYMYGIFYENITKKKYMKSIFAVVVMLILFYIEILSGSRGGLLAIAGMIFVITVLNMKNRAVRRKILFIALIAVVVLTVIMQMLPEQILDRFSLESLLGEKDSGGGRLELWDAAWSGIKDNFIFGYGAGCAVPAVGIYHGINRASHSLYLSSVLEFGIFACLLYIPILSEIKKSYKNKQYMEVGMAFGILIASIFLDALSTKFFWAFLIILFTRNSNEGEDVKEN